MEVLLTIGKGLTNAILLATLGMHACKEPAQRIIFHGTQSYRPVLLQQLRERFPEPISISPDGTKLLLRTLNSEGRPFGLEVLELATHKPIAQISFPEDPMRICWRPDSASISFFVQNLQKTGRSLHLWRFASGQDDTIATPPAKAEPNMMWSPDSRYFAYIEGGLGLVMIDTRASHPLVHIEKGADYIFYWLADSKTIAYVPHGHGNLIRVISLKGHALQEITLPGDNQLLDMVYYAAQKEFVITTRTPAHPFTIETVRAEPFKVTPIYASEVELDTPHILANGKAFLVEVVDHGMRSIVVIDLQHGASAARILTGAGDNHFEAADPKSHFFLFTLRGDYPPSIRKYDFESGKTAEVYQSRSGLPHIKAEQHWASSSDGVRVPLYVWRGEENGAAKGAIIRLHAFNVKETPIWQDEIQMMASQGITYVACNFRGSLGLGFDYEKAGTPDNQIADVIGAIEYVHRQFGIPYDRIVLIGYSAGAGLALRTAIEKLPEPGILALVGMSSTDLLPGVMNRDHHPHVLFFHGTYEDEPLERLTRLAESVASMSHSGKDVELYELNDNHDFNYPESRASIYSAILDSLDRRSSAIR
jgi:predicted esterase